MSEKVNYITVETHKSLHHKSLRNFKSLRFLVIFDDFPKKKMLNRYGFLDVLLQQFMGLDCIIIMFGIFFWY